MLALGIIAIVFLSIALVFDIIGIFSGDEDTFVLGILHAVPIVLAIVTIALNL